MNISKEDVNRVADDIGVSLTDVDVSVILENYEIEQMADTTGTWDLIVENLIYRLAN